MTPKPCDEAPVPRARVFDREAVRAVDRAAIEEYGIPGIVLMENAAIALLTAALRMIGEGREGGGRALIVCGRGNNGGDGWALARHLHNAGVEPRVVSLGDPREGTDAAVNRMIAGRMCLPVMSIREFDAPGSGVDLIVDAVFGTGLDRPLTGEAREVVEKMNARPEPILAVDVPSGLDCNTGEVLGVTVRATTTVTFVGRKPAFDLAAVREYVGEVVVAPIGAPRELADRFGRPIP